MARHSGLPKVRTGCRTCKARKVKCDEAKPFCVRCKTAKRECGGYEQFQSGEHRNLTWYRPQQLAVRDQKEGKAFQFFAINVGPVLSGTRSSDFWSHVVMQFSHFSPAIRHAVLSISSLYEDFQSGRQVSSRLPSSPFAIKHYAASINQIKTARDENIALLACVLYLCIEYLLENIDAAVQHCRHGVAILNNESCSTWVRQHIAPILRRISLLPFFSGVPRVNQVASSDTVLADYGKFIPFDSVAQAEDCFEGIETQARVLRPFGDSLPPFEKTVTRSKCLRLIAGWEVHTAMLESSQPDMSVQDLVALRRIAAMKEVLRLRVLCCLDEPETRFDKHLESFKAILRLAEESAELRASVSSSTSRPVFTFEEGFLPPLMFVANMCRHFATRMRALELMSLVPAAKEGPIDLGTLYRASQRVVEIEHGITLDDDDCDLATEEEVPYPPVDKRVICIPVKDHHGMVSDSDGANTPSRPFKIISRGPNGKHSTRIEHIADKPPKHRPYLPSMRCAKPMKSEGSHESSSLPQSRPRIKDVTIAVKQSTPQVASSHDLLPSSLSGPERRPESDGTSSSSREESCRNYWKF